MVWQDKRQIYMDYKYAVDKRKQLQISAQLNGVDRDTIKRIIRDYMWKGY